MKENKKRIFIDMDGVLCNFNKAMLSRFLQNRNLKELTIEQEYPQSKVGFFLNLEEMPDAIESFKKLQEKYDVWILTRPSFMNVQCYTEKAQWVMNHLGFDVLKQTIMAGNKSLLKGDYLIDDMNTDHQSEFEGQWIEFGSDRFPNWKSVIDYLL